MSKTELLLYTRLTHRASYLLEQAVERVVPINATKLVHTLKSLARRLKEPNNGLKIAVLLTVNRQELQELLSLSPMLEGLRVILVLPDADPRTIAQGHSLRPRYVTDIHSDFQDVAAVLRKILKSSPGPVNRYRSGAGGNPEDGEWDAPRRPLSRP